VPVIALLATLTPTPGTRVPWPYLEVIVEVHVLFRVLSTVRYLMCILLSPSGDFCLGGPLSFVLADCNSTSRAETSRPSCRRT